MAETFACKTRVRREQFLVAGLFSKRFLNAHEFCRRTSWCPLVFAGVLYPSASPHVLIPLPLHRSQNHANPPVGLNNNTTPEKTTTPFYFPSPYKPRHTSSPNKTELIGPTRMSDRPLSKLNQAYSVIVAPAASFSRSLIPAAIFVRDTLYEPANAPPECRKSRQAFKTGGRTPEKQHG